MSEKIVDFISLPSGSLVRSVLLEAQNNIEAQMKALSTCTAFLCQKYFEGEVCVQVRDASAPGATDASA